MYVCVLLAVCMYVCVCVFVDEYACVDWWLGVVFHPKKCLVLLPFDFETCVKYLTISISALQ